MNTNIRKVKKEDITALKEVLDSSELFPSYLLDDMIQSYLSNTASHDIWFTATDKNIPIAIGYCAPEKFTEGTYNLYAIAVHKDYQGKGVGSAMMNYIESVLQKNESRILIVETSGTAAFTLTRKFYKQCNYTQQAIIPEFYDKGDDKVIFWKKLN